MTKKKYLSFEVDEKKTKIRNILNQDFLEIELWMIADHEPNNNMSHFTLESMKDAIPTFYNKPILGSFMQIPGEQDGDFGGHDSLYTTDEESGADYFDNSGPNQEVPLGLITESSKVEIVEGPDGANWIKANGFLWVKYASKQVLALLRKRKGKTKISVEVEVLNSTVDEETGIEHINKFNFLGVTCLGSYAPGNGLLGVRQEIHEGIEGANGKVVNFSENPKFQERLHKLTMAYEEFEKNMNFKNSENQNQNEENKISDEGKTDLAVEGQDIYHPHPQNPENEDVPVIGYDDENKDTEKDKDNTDNKETESERKEKKFSMLTYNMKRQLLDSALSECIANNYGDKGYGWIQDFTEVECYFYLDCTGEEDGTYVAPYTITLKTEDGEEKVDNCVIDFAQKERAIQTWRKMSEDSEGTEKTDMNKDEFGNDVTQNPSKDGIVVMQDDRATEAPKSGSEDTAKPASHKGEDRAEPAMGTYEDDKDKDADKEKECNMSENDKDKDKDKDKDAEKDGDKEKSKENEACGNKETEGQEVSEVKGKNVGGTQEVTEVKSKAAHAEENPEDKKETEACGDKKTEGCDCDKDGDKENEACDDKEKECNYEAKFAQLSADYVAMQKENETLKTVNSKLEADVADLMSKVTSFEAESKARHNADMFAFASKMIEAETDLSDDCRKTMSEEVKTECEASKFASEDEVKKFTVTKIAMALYEARKSEKNVGSKGTNNSKQEFVQNIVKPTPSVDALTASRKALENLDSDEE